MLKRLKANKQKQLREETTEFLTASQTGDLERVSEFIRNNFDINSKNENGLSGLHLASKEGQTGVIRELLRHGADVNSTTKKGNVALHMACVSGQLEAVKVLLENGADINVQSENGFTPLYIAAQENRNDLLRFLLIHGADSKLKTDDFFLPLDIALQQGNGKVVECLLENDPSNKVALPALHFAAKSNDVRVAEFLLEDGCDVNRLSASGFTALHIGSRYGNLEVCQVLIGKGADVNFKAKNDIIPLHVCSKEGHSAIVELLLSHGSELNSQTAEGLTALHCAAVSGHDQAVDSLVRSGASLALKTKNGLTPLHMALQGNQVGCTRQLLQYNAPIDDFTEDNLTPLHVAAHCGNLRSAQILLEAGCDVTSKAKNGFSPLHVASKRNHREMVELLLQFEADVNETSNNDILPIHIAAFMGHMEILRSLIQHGTSLDGPTNEGMTPVYLAALANRTDTIALLLQSGANVDAMTAEQRTALHVASELGNTDDVVHLLQHGASPHIKTSEKFLPLNFATRAGHRDIVQLLLDHGGLNSEGSFQKTPSTASALKEFSTVRENMRYIKDENDGIKSPVLKRKSLEGFNSSSPSRPKTFDRESRLSHTHSSLILPGSPSLSFWTSFLTDARGGEMIGCRHSGVRVILPPSKIPNPIGIKCKLIRKEKLPYPPPLKEGEGLACRALETSPPGAKFLGPVIFEVPHFASLHDQEREIVILRSDDGRSWNEHLPPSLDDLEPVLKSALLSDMMQPNSSLMRIITVDLPRFFTLVSRIRLKQEEFSADGGSMSSALTPKVKISFPPESFKRKMKVGLQVQPVSQDTVLKLFGDESCVSPIVTIEPRRRKFHSPVSMTMPLPEDNVTARNTRLLCSISDGKNQAVWEDITDLTPLTTAKDLVSFTTLVSGKYWLLSSPRVDLSVVQKLYSIAIPVPYFSKFVIFAKRLSLVEGRLRVFCMTDDKVDKTLERQEQFVEVARSDDVEVLDGTAQYIHLEGNVLPTDVSSRDQLHLNFHAFWENRLPLTVRVVDPTAEASGFMTFMKDPGTRSPKSDICTLKVTLPSFDDGTTSEKIQFNPLFQTDKSNAKKEEPELLKAELRLSDVAESIGENWKQVAEQLGIPKADVDMIQSEYEDPVDQAFAVLQQWMDENGSKANGNSLEKALRDLGMDDVIASCMCNVADVTDAEEKAAARSYLDAGADPLKADMGSARDLGSAHSETIRHSLSPDDAYEDSDLCKESGLHLPRERSDENNKYIEDMFRESRVGERFPFMDRSVSTMSTNTLTTLPSDVETLYQSTEEVSDGDQTIVKAEVHEEEKKLEDGSSLSRKVVTLKHFKCCKGSEDLLTRVEIDEENMVLPPGVKLPLGDDVTLETDVGNFEETLENGVLLIHKVTFTKAIKETPGERDAPDQGTNRLMLQDFAVDHSSLVSPSAENSPSDLDTHSGPQLQSSSPSGPGDDVPVVEEELVEEKNRRTFSSSPWTTSKWNARGALAEGEESQEGINGSQSSSESSVDKQSPSEIGICGVISQSDNETRLITKKLEFGPNFEIPSDDPGSPYPEEERYLLPDTTRKPLLESDRKNESLSQDVSVGGKQSQSTTESLYKYLESGPQNEFLLEDPVTEDRQSKPEFQCKYFDSPPQHEFPLKELALGFLMDGRQTVMQSACEYLDSQPQDEVILQDTESGHQREGMETPMNLESGLLYESLLQDSTLGYLNKESHDITVSCWKYSDSRTQNERHSDDPAPGDSGERRLHVTGLEYLESASQLKLFSQEPAPEERHPTTESAYKYLNSGPKHEVLETEYPGDGSQLIAEFGYKHLESGPLHSVTLNDAASEYPRDVQKNAKELAYENLESETQHGFESEDLASEYPLERKPRSTQKSISNEVDSPEYLRCGQIDFEPKQINDLTIKDKLSPPSFEGNAEVDEEKSTFEGKLLQLCQLSPLPIHDYVLENNGYNDNRLNDQVSGRKIFEDEEGTEAEKLKHARVVLRRRVHKKTMVTAGCQEETVVTEDTQVEQDNETPKELNSAIQKIIEQFVQGDSAFVTSYNAC